MEVLGDHEGDDRIGEVGAEFKKGAGVALGRVVVGRREDGKHLAAVALFDAVGHTLVRADEQREAVAGKKRVCHVRPPQTADSM